MLRKLPEGLTTISTLLVYQLHYRCQRLTVDNY